MYSIGKKTFITFSSQEKIDALKKCSTVEERYEVSQKFSHTNKSFCLNGFWSEESVIKFLKKRNLKGKAKVSHTVLNYSKYGRNYDEKTFEIII